MGIFAEVWSQRNCTCPNRHEKDFPMPQSPFTSSYRRSEELDLASYNTDKINNHYLERYDPFFSPLADQPISMLELGIWKGGSLRLWRDYFPEGNIVGVDMVLRPGVVNEERITVHQGSQSDGPFLQQLAQQHAPEGFDIIIDDAAHVGALAKASFDALFEKHLKPGGWYIIEDWPTGYFEDWGDGISIHRKPTLLNRLGRRLARWGYAGLKRPWISHNYGMVGFIKQLVDEQSAFDASRGGLHLPPTRETPFESMTITPSIVFIKKKK